MISISNRLKVLALAFVAAASLLFATPKAAEAAAITTGVVTSINDARPATAEKSYYYVRRYYVRRYYRPRYRYYRPRYRYYRPYRRFYY